MFDSVHSVDSFSPGIQTSLDSGHLHHIVWLRAQCGEVQPWDPDLPWPGYYKVIEAILIEIYFDYFYIIPIEILTSIRILLIWIEPKYLVDFDANSVHLDRNEKNNFFKFQSLGENIIQLYSRLKIIFFTKTLEF